jgi:hypothetical protein
MSICESSSVKPRQTEFICSGCDAERGCDCNAPAITRAEAALKADPGASGRAIAKEGRHKSDYGRYSHGVGQQSAAALSKTMRNAGLAVEVHIPPEVGDWNDVLMKGDYQ